MSQTQISLVPPHASQSDATDKALSRQPIDQLHDRALYELRRALQEQPRFVKVHAAESLLALGYGQDVLAAFEVEHRLYGDDPTYRIGIWRVLSRATSDPQQRQQFINNIRDVYRAPQTLGSPAAVESLSKLQYEIPAEDRAWFKQMTDDAAVPGAPYRRWVLANNGTDEDFRFLADLLESPNAMLRAITGYSLRHLAPKLPPDVIQRLAKAALEEPLSTTRVYLFSAAFVTATDHQEAARFKRLLLPCAQSGTKDEKYETCAALAIRGDQADLPLLESLLDDLEPDVCVGAATAILWVQSRLQTGRDVEAA